MEMPLSLNAMDCEVKLLVNNRLYLFESSQQGWCNGSHVVRVEGYTSTAHFFSKNTFFLQLRYKFCDCLLIKQIQRKVNTPVERAVSSVRCNCLYNKKHHCKRKSILNSYMVCLQKKKV